MTIIAHKEKSPLGDLGVRQMELTQQFSIVQQCQVERLDTQ
jgi:hypothetical protein